MAKHLIVDGFNVIRRDPELSGIENRTFYGAQKALIEKLGHYRKGTAHRITVVFDGHGGQHTYRHQQQQNGLTIIYSAQGETADEVIAEMAANRQGDQSGKVVVTADRALMDICRYYRVTVISPAELIRRSRPATMPRNDPEFYHGKQEERGWSGHTRKKGNAHRAPKQRRRQKGLW